MRYLAVGLLALLVACSALTAQDKIDIAQYGAEQSACVAMFSPDKTQIDKCRAGVVDQYSKKWWAEGGPFAVEAGVQ